MVLALIPQHAERIAPPRTLTVPYPLGRPLGVPGDAGFQHRVLSAALGLLEISDQLVFEAYEEDAPELGVGEEAWTCPVSFAAATADSSLARQVLDEMALLQPWYDKARQSQATSVGVSGLALEAAVMFVASFLDPDSPATIGGEAKPAAELLKHAVEDIKAFYNEAAASQPGSATVKEMEDWYWGETSAGRLVRAVKQASLEHEDSGIRIAASFLLVPGSQAFRDSA